MQPVIFYIKRSVVRNLRFSYSILGVACIVFAVDEFSNLILQADYGPLGEFLLPPGYEFWWHAVPAAILTVSGVACVSGSLRVYRRGSPDQNFLRLDNDGLTYMSWGHRRQWSWRELPSFQVTKRAIFGHRFLEFALPDALDWWTRLGLWSGVKKSPGDWVAPIADIYGAPIDEIAAQLDGGRKAALSAESDPIELP